MQSPAPWVEQPCAAILEQLHGTGQAECTENDLRILVDKLDVSQQYNRGKAG